MSSLKKSRRSQVHVAKKLLWHRETVMEGGDRLPLSGWFGRRGNMDTSVVDHDASSRCLRFNVLLTSRRVIATSLTKTERVSRVDLIRWPIQFSTSCLVRMQANNWRFLISIIQSGK